LVLNQDNFWNTYILLLQSSLVTRARCAMGFQIGLLEKLPVNVSVK